ncbi:PRC-barrel domain-containing protein [Pelagivirga sediminicola]|uniref:PRC-barrel domain-containing protein n=1 Tax=Pelagivirga sediminicola TaxID=2170575 RepID=UPI001A9C3275|nr:PRC-barrel domain-containing protein [Pelagivirga sediminicola]
MSLKTLMMTAAISALISGGAIAQTTSDDVAPANDSMATTDVDAGAAAMPAEFTSINEMTVGDLVGQNVYQPNGDTIGDIDYVVGQSGSASAIIGIGGFLGLGEYTVAVPLDDFSYDASQQMVVLDETKETLKERPEFDESGTESLPDETPLADLMASVDGSSSTSATEGDGTQTDDPAAAEDPAASTDDTGAAAEGDAAADTDMSTSDDGSGDAATDDAATDDAATDDAATDDAATDDAATDDAATDDTATDDAATDDAATDDAATDDAATDDAATEDDTATE